MERKKAELNALTRRLEEEKEKHRLARSSTPNSLTEESEYEKKKSFIISKVNPNFSAMPSEECFIY